MEGSGVDRSVVERRGDRRRWEGIGKDRRGRGVGVSVVEGEWNRVEWVRVGFGVVGRGEEWEWSGEKWGWVEWSERMELGGLGWEGREIEWSVGDRNESGME